MRTTGIINWLSILKNKLGDHWAPFSTYVSGVLLSNECETSPAHAVKAIQQLHTNILNFKTKQSKAVLGCVDKESVCSALIQLIELMHQYKQTKPVLDADLKEMLALAAEGKSYFGNGDLIADRLIHVYAAKDITRTFMVALIRLALTSIQPKAELLPLIRDLSRNFLPNSVEKFIKDYGDYWKECNKQRLMDMDVFEVFAEHPELRDKAYLQDNPHFQELCIRPQEAIPSFMICPIGQMPMANPVATVVAITHENCGIYDKKEITKWFAAKHITDPLSRQEVLPNVASCEHVASAINIYKYVLRTIALLAYKVNDFDKAVCYFSQLVEFNPSCSNTTNNLMLSFLQKNKFEGAIRAYEEHAGAKSSTTITTEIHHAAALAYRAYHSPIKANHVVIDNIHYALKSAREHGLEEKKWCDRYAKLGFFIAQRSNATSESGRNTISFLKSFSTTGESETFSSAAFFNPSCEVASESQPPIASPAPATAHQ